MKAKRPTTRKPVRGAGRRRVATATAKQPALRTDAEREFNEAIRVNGIVEVCSLEDSDCLASIRDYVSTQSLELDRLLSGKGVPCGRVTEIFGPNHLGKSTILDHIIAECQRRGGVGVLIDSEGARDVQYSRAIGVDTGKLKYLEFEPHELHMENVLMRLYDVIEYWVSKDPDRLVVIGWDSLGGTSTRDELDKRLAKDSRPAMAASVLRRACRQIPPKLGNSRIAVVVVNHEYMNLDLHGHVGVKKETYGGEAMRLLASLRIQLYHAGWIKNGDGVILGRELGAKLIKSRIGKPWGEARVAMIPGVGIDNVWSVYERLRHQGVIQSSGSWSAINLDGEKIAFQGWLGLLQKCRDDETLFARLASVYQGVP